MLCKVTIQDQIYEYESGTSFEEIARDLQDTCEHTIVLVFEDGRLRELHHHLKRDCEISFITTADKIGFETYRRSCSMLFLSSVNRLYGDAVKNVILHFSVSDGFYYTVGGEVELNEKEIQTVKNALAGWSYVARTAIEEAMKKTKKPEKAKKPGTEQIQDSQ